MPFQITSLTIVYSTVYSNADQRKNTKAPRHWPCAGNSPVTGEFPAQKASDADECFHLMTSSWIFNVARINHAMYGYRGLNHDTDEDLALFILDYLSRLKDSTK